MSFKDNNNLDDLCSLKNELDILLKSNDVENAKYNSNSCVSKAKNIIMSSANLSGMVKDNNVYKKKKKMIISHGLITHVVDLEISIMKQRICV